MAVEEEGVLAPAGLFLEEIIGLIKERDNPIGFDKVVEKVDKLDTKIASQTLIDIVDIIARGLTDKVSTDDSDIEFGDSDIYRLIALHYILAERIKQSPDEMDKLKESLGPNGIEYYLNLELDQ